MKYVLDSSVALKWVLAESDSAKAVRLRGEYVAGLHDFHAPDIFASEIANGLVFAERQGRIQPGESIIFLNYVLSTAPRLHVSPLLLVRAVEMALLAKRAVYDCIYLALAERDG